MSSKENYVGGAFYEPKIYLTEIDGIKRWLFSGPYRFQLELCARWELWACEFSLGTLYIIIRLVCFQASLSFLFIRLTHYTAPELEFVLNLLDNVASASVQVKERKENSNLLRLYAFIRHWIGVANWSHIYHMRYISSDLPRVRQLLYIPSRYLV